MSVIVDIPMPESCGGCPIADIVPVFDKKEKIFRHRLHCDLIWDYVDWDERNKRCPLREYEDKIKTGKWERHNTYHGDDVSGFIDPDWRCSECGEQMFLYDLTNFCPNCGADMRGKQE